MKESKTCGIYNVTEDRTSEERHNSRRAKRTKFTIQFPSGIFLVIKGVMMMRMMTTRLQQSPATQNWINRYRKWTDGCLEDDDVLAALLSPCFLSSQR